LAGTSGGMAPGFETSEALEKSKASAEYWAKQKEESLAAKN